jgi:hypothetical protein
MVALKVALNIFKNNLNQIRILEYSKMVKKNEAVAVNAEVNVVLKKRGRKSKKELESAQQLQNADNINVTIEDAIEVQPIVVENEPIFSVSNTINTTMNNTNNTNDAANHTNDDEPDEDAKPVAKKRGRKPKGGKIIQQATPLANAIESKPNVILHLKCSIKDLHSTSAGNGCDIQSFDLQNSAHLAFDVIDPDGTNYDQHVLVNNDITSAHQKITDDDLDYDDNKYTKDADTKDVWKKLKILEHSLHVNNICDKKSACFWCTYEFDNPPVYIPKYFIKDSYQVYGCFCSPECATAYLMEENIDSSSKFERYHLINHVYSKIYNYDKNIKPAPNPYYMLDKYYGNLTIQEYRSLLRNERLFLIVDKPLTRILPELHEDNDDFIINNKIIPSNAYQIKKKLQKKQTKTNILSERFGLSQQSH